MAMLGHAVVLLLVGESRPAFIPIIPIIPIIMHSPLKREYATETMAAIMAALRWNVTELYGTVRDARLGLILP